MPSGILSGLFCTCETIEPTYEYERIKDPKISIIVPVYKCEDSLSATIHSIQSQTFTDFEVIFIDDASPDESSAIIEPLLAIDNRFRLIRHSRNLGLGGARNTGLRNARAPYIMSVDSDDFMRPNMATVLYESIDGTEHEFVACSFARVTPQREVVSTQRMADKVHYIDEHTNIFGLVNPSFWNKIWRRSSYVENGIWFPNYLYYQDSVTTPRILAKSVSIKTIPDVLYDYVVRPDSITTTVSDKHLIDFFSGFDVLSDFLLNNDLWDSQKVHFFDRIDRSMTHHLENGARRSDNFALRSVYVRNLLRLKVGYIATAPLLMQSSDQFVDAALGRAHSLLDIIGNADLQVLPVTVIVKSFLRPQITTRLLRSIVDYQREKGVKFEEVIVVDDSPGSSQAHLKALIEAMSAQAPELNIRLICLKDIVGTSAGRNIAVDAAKSEFILQCDDDFIFDNLMNIDDAITQIREYSYDILGGWLKDKYNIIDETFKYRATQGFFTSTENGLVSINCRNDIKLGDKPVDSEYIAQFFLAKSSVLKAIKWDADLRTEEHQEFFFRLKRAAVKVGLTNRLVVKHTASKKDNPPEYNAFRYGKKEWLNYIVESTKKMGAVRRVIQSHDDSSYFRWIVDLDGHFEKQLHLPISNKFLYQSVEMHALSDLCPKQENIVQLYSDSDEGPWVITSDSIELPTDHKVDSRTKDALPTPRQTLISRSGKRIIVDVGGLMDADSKVVSSAGANAELFLNSYALQKEDYSFFVHADESGWREIENSAICFDHSGLKVAVVTWGDGTSENVGWHILSIFKFSDTPLPGWTNRPLGNILETLRHNAELVSSWRLNKRPADDNGVSSSPRFRLGKIQFSPDGSRVLLITSEQKGEVTLASYSPGQGGVQTSVSGLQDAVWLNNSDVVGLAHYKDVDSDITKCRVLVFEFSSVLKIKTLKESVTLSDQISLSFNSKFLILAGNCSTTKFPYNTLSVFRLDDGQERVLGIIRHDELWYEGVRRVRTKVNPEFLHDGLFFNSSHNGFQRVYRIDYGQIERSFELDTMAPPVETLREQFSGQTKSSTGATSVRELKNEFHDLRPVKSFKDRHKELIDGLYYKGEYQAYLLATSDFLNHQSQDADLHFKRSRSFMECGDYSNAMSSIDAALKLAPEKSIFLRHKSNIFNALGDKERAFSFGLAAISADPTVPSHSLHVARMALALGMNEVAIEYGDRAIEVSDTDHRAYNLVAEALSQRPVQSQETIAKAIASLRRAQELAPTGTSYLSRIIELENKAFKLKQS